MRLGNKELLPSTDADRNLGLLDFTILWGGMAIQIAGFMSAAQLYPGLSASNILIGVGVGFTLITILLVLIGDIGLTYGIPFTVYMRACFGYKGAHIAGFLRIIPCIFWFGFQTFIAANALNAIMGMFFGVSNVILLLILFGAFQIINAAFGIKGMAKFNWIAVPLLVILLSVAIIALFNVKDTNLLDVFAAPSDNSLTITSAILVAVGGWITMVLNSSDLTRKLKKNKEHDTDGFFKRNKKAIIGQVLGLVFVGSLLFVVGSAFGVVTGLSEPVDIINQVFEGSSILTLVIAYLIIAFSQWSTNTVANLMPPAYIIINFFPKLNFATAVTIAGTLGLLVMPWKLVDNLVAFQVFIAGALGPVAGIMIADYYFIRKRKLNVKDLYKEEGQYTYKNDYNPAAIWTLIISFIPALFMGEYAFYVGFGISMILYTVLMKKFILNKYDQKLGEVILLEPEVEKNSEGIYE